MKKIRPFLAVSTALVFLLAPAFIFNSDTGPNRLPVNGYGSNLNPAVNRGCATEEYMKLQLEKYPTYKKTMETLEQQVNAYIENNKDKVRSGIITIPTVFHIVYNAGQPSQNLSYSQIQTQLDVLNKDFTRTNSDTNLTPAAFKPLGADVQVRFCMARRDPDNNPSVGVTRTSTTAVQFGLDDAVKFTSLGGRDAWDRNKYLNVWVCNLEGGLLGYAQYPGGNPATDGVVIDFQYTGTIGTASPPFHLGRTATHEVGHWLALRHIWGDDNGACWGNDGIDDTPNQAGETGGCPLYPRLDACTPNAPGIMFMNYMDYSDDACMNIFTTGQSTMMNAVMNTSRLPLQSSSGCSEASGIPIAAFSSDSVSILFGNSVHFSDQSAGIPTSRQWTFTGGNPLTSTQQNQTVQYSTPGHYTVKLRVSNSFGSDSLTIVNYIKVRGADLNTIALVSPPNLTRQTVSGSDTSRVHFTWRKSSSHPSVNYKFKIRKTGNNPEFVFTSNSGGSDSAASIKKSTLDSIAQIIGTTGDSVRCSWRALAYNGVDSLTSNTFLITLVRSTIGIQVISTEIPGRFELYSNYPNPFNPVTKIRFDVPNFNGEGIVNITVYDILGKQTAVLVNKHLKAGKYETDWDASHFPSGIYFYRITTGDFTQTRKMILVK
jgi:PKD repeat protein